MFNMFYPIAIGAKDLISSLRSKFYYFFIECCLGNPAAVPSSHLRKSIIFNMINLEGSNVRGISTLCAGAPKNVENHPSQLVILSFIFLAHLFFPVSPVFSSVGKEMIMLPYSPIPCSGEIFFRIFSVEIYPLFFQFKPMDTMIFFLLFLNFFFVSLIIQAPFFDVFKTVFLRVFETISPVHVQLYKYWR